MYRLLFQDLESKFHLSFPLPSAEIPNLKNETDAMNSIESSQLPLDADASIFSHKNVTSLPKDSIYCQQQDIHSLPDTISNLESRMGHLMINTQMHDVTFEVGTQQLQYTTIRSILSSISQVFYKMFFASNMKESIDKSRGLVIKIPDVQELGFENVLYFAFSGSAKCYVKLQSTNILPTLKVADKYQINGLISLCKQFLNQSIQVDNVISLLIVGDKLCNMMDYKNIKDIDFNESVCDEKSNSNDIIIANGDNENKMNGRDIDHDFKSDESGNGNGNDNENGKQFELYQLYSKCIHFIQNEITKNEFEKNIFNTTNCQEFIYLTPNILCNLLKMNQVCCKEEIIWKACLDWYKYNSKHNYNDNDNNNDNHNTNNNNGRFIQTEVNLKSFIKHIRFNLMPSQFFHDKVESSGMLTTDEICSVYRKWTINSAKCMFNCTPRTSNKTHFAQGWNTKITSHPSLVTFSGKNDKIVAHSDSSSHCHIYANQTFSEGRHSWIVTIKELECCGWVGVTYLDKINNRTGFLQYDVSTWCGGYGGAAYLYDGSPSNGCVMGIDAAKISKVIVSIDLDEKWIQFTDNTPKRKKKRVTCRFRENVSVVPVVDCDENATLEIDIVS